MPSTYSGNLLLELMADGEKDGLWGDITNENLEILGRAISGVTTVSLAGTTHTLTVSQGSLSEGHYAVLELGGSPTGTNTITISPNTVARVYIVNNGSGQDAVFTQGSGGNVTVADGDGAIIYCDGAGAGAKVTDVTAALTFMLGSNNLSDVSDAAASLVNLGLTATAAELNKVDGFTGTFEDLNYAKDLRATGVTAAEFDTLDGFTGTVNDLNYAKDLRATGVTTTEFDKLDGVTWTLVDYNTLTSTAAELNLLDGKTLSGSDTQIVTGTAGTDGDIVKWNADGDLVSYGAATQAEATWEAGTGTTESLVSPAKIKAAIDANKPSTTATATLSGTAVDFTSLPTGLSRVWVVFKDCSVSTSSMSIQLSTGSTFATSGYNSTYVFNTGVVTRTDMFLTGISTTGFNGVYEFFKIPETDEWVGSLGGAGAQFYTAGGRSPDLGGALDGIRITSITGSATLSGEVVVYYT